MSGPSSNFLDPLLSPTHQDDGLDMIRRKNINFIGFTLTDNPTTNATDIVGAGGGVTHGTADQALVTNGAGTASLFAKIVNANVDAAAAIVLSKLGQTSATTGQVVTWSGTAWIAATPAAGTGGVAPGTNGQILATVGGVVTWRTVGGDITGAPDAIVVGKIKGTTVTTAGGALTTGQSLRVTAAAAADWGPVDLANANAVTGTLPVGNIPSLAGDVTGTILANTVAKVRGVAIGTAGGALATGLFLQTTGVAAADWALINAVASIGPGAADTALVTNGAASATAWAKIVDANVASAAGIVLSKLGQSAATSGQVPSWNGSAWVPTTIAVGLGGITPGTNGQVLATVVGAAAWATFGGDITGAPTAIVVGKVKGTTVTTAGGALTTGQSLRVTGVATADWGPIDLSNANAVTGTLPIATTITPGTNGQIFVTNATPAGAWATAAGDWAGSVTANVVGKIKGTTVTTAGGALTTGQSLRVTGVATADWGPIDLSNPNAVTGTLPGGSLPESAFQYHNVADIAAMQALVVTTFLDGTHCWVRTKDHAYILKTTAQTADPDLDTYNSATGGRLWMGFS